MTLRECIESWTRVRRVYRWLGLVALASVAVTGCGGGGPESGDANYSQKFEKPTDPASAPAPKAVPQRKSPRDANDLSPRERRAQEKAAK